MSADTSLAIAKFKDGYYYAVVQAVENLDLKYYKSKEEFADYVLSENRIGPFDSYEDFFGEAILKAKDTEHGIAFIGEYEFISLC